MRRFHGNPFGQAGLTLIELAIVLVVLGLVLGMTLPLISELSKQRHYRSTQRDMEEIKEALAGYAGIHAKLPWADTNGDGVGDSGQSVGAIAYVEVGLGATDAWRKAYRYDVNDRLTTTTSLAALCTALSLIGPNEFPQVAFSPGGTPSPQAVVIVSGGENSTLDGENGDGDRSYEALAQSSSYDDLVLAISPNTLYGQLSCGAQQGGTGCTQYTVFNRRPVDIYVRGGAYLTCTRIIEDQPFILGQGQTINVYRNQNQCQNNVKPDTVTYSQAQAVDTDADCRVRWTNQGLQDE